MGTEECPRGIVVLARVLSVLHWDLLTPEEQHIALLGAYMFGADLAQELHEDGDEEAFGDGKDYRRVVIRWAHEDVGACSDVEAQIWRSITADRSDPRMAAFAAGFREEKNRLSGS